MFLGYNYINNMELKDSVIGIELGSTRIKAVLLDSNHKIISSGEYAWENSFINGIWTYSLDDVKKGLQACFADLKSDFKNKYNKPLSKTGAIGISAMMHGYLPFDKNDSQLCEFRTWRNTITSKAQEELSKLFDFNIPQRWSIAHLYQAILNKEDHLKDLSYITTLAGYVHYLLTGKHIVGIDEASGIFPIDSNTLTYNKQMLDTFNNLENVKVYNFDLNVILPEVKVAGEDAGTLTKEGALYLDPSGEFSEGIKVVPCEGDAGTGMVATNSIRVNTGNVSAGTSDFAMIVVDKMPKMHKEIDMVVTPSGKPVAMVHCNNCTSDINAWAIIIKEALEAFGKKVDTNVLYTTLFNKALEGDVDCGDVLSFNYYSGEGVVDLDEGRIVQLRKADSKFNLANLMRNNLFSALATLKIGLDILINEEHIKIDRIYGHGGYFKTPKVGQTILSAAISCPVSIMEQAGEGGPYGMALLCAYALWKEEGEDLEDYLDNKVFKDAKTTSIMASKEEVEGFNRYLERYKKALAVEKSAIENY